MYGHAVPIVIHVNLRVQCSILAVYFSKELAGVCPV